MAQNKSTQKTQSGQPRDGDGRFVEKADAAKDTKSTGGAKDAEGKSSRGEAPAKGAKAR